MSTTPEHVYDEVRDYYAEAARAASSGAACCGPDAVALGHRQLRRSRRPARRRGARQHRLREPDRGRRPPTRARPCSTSAPAAASTCCCPPRRVGPSGFAYGLDMTDEMLDLARRNAADAGATNVEFLQGHMEDIPLPDASVDVVISNCVINLSPDKPAVFAEMHRVLAARWPDRDQRRRHRGPSHRRRASRARLLRRLHRRCAPRDRVRRRSCEPPDSSTCRSRSRTRSATASTARSSRQPSRRQ